MEILTATKTRPLETVLGSLHIYPNPFSVSTFIAYELAGKAQVEIAIYNSCGQKVRTIINENQWAGWNRVEWQGTGDKSKTLPNGLYFCRMKIDGRMGPVAKIMMVY